MTGALEHVMFPDDPVRNAPRIFQTLRTVFPLEPGATTAALFFEISWGLGDVAKIRLGALGRWRPGADDRELVLIGTLDIALPTRPHDVLRIHVDALGVINWTDGTEVSVFLIRARDTAPSPDARTVLTGYGGFAITMGPA